MSKRIRLFPTVVTAAALAVAALAGCGSQTGATANSQGSGAGSGTPITIAVSTTTTSQPAYVAAAKGFFKKNGLDAKLVKLENKTNLVDGLGHNFNFGITYMPVPISARTHGLDIVAVAGSNVGGPGTTGDLELMVAPGSKITNVSQLAGKKIGAGTVNGVTHLMTLAWLQQSGVNPTSVTGIALPIGTMGDQLKAGRIDAAEVTQPYITQLEAKGYKSLGDPENHVLTGPTVLSIWAASQTWANSHKSVVQEYQKSMQEAIAWIKANRNAANQILSQQIGVSMATINSAPPMQFQANVSTSDFAPFVSMEKKVGWLTVNVSPSQLVFQ